MMARQDNPGFIDLKSMLSKVADAHGAIQEDVRVKVGKHKNDRYVKRQKLTVERGLRVDGQR